MKSSILRLLACSAVSFVQSIALAAPGDLDSLDANITGTSAVYATALQADGKIIIGGRFTSVLGVARNYIARLNTDGTLDAGFNPKANSDVYSLAVQADGKILIGGAFTSLQPNGTPIPVARQQIARLNGNGTLDTGYNPTANGNVTCIVLQPDGKALLGGHFLSFNPGGFSFFGRQHLARINTNGTVDTNFIADTNNSVSSIALQPDGKVLLSGAFDLIRPNGAASFTTRMHAARVNADGTLDTPFDPAPNENTLCVAVQADGKVLLCGRFTTLQPNGATSPITRQYIARMNADGSLDEGFDPSPDKTVDYVVAQVDGRLVLGGDFTMLQANGAASPTPRQRIARINADGTLDMGFDPSANGYINWLAIQPDGKVLVGGIFTTFQPNGAASPATRKYFARLTNDPVPPLEIWRRTYFGSTAFNTGLAADTADFDEDGPANLAEYALNLPPTVPSQPPPAERHLYAEGERLRMFLTRDSARNDVTIEVQAADNPAGPWTTVAASTLGGVTTGSGYVGGDDALPGLKTVEVRDTVDISPTTPSRYLRVKVTH